MPCVPRVVALRASAAVALAALAARAQDLDGRAGEPSALRELERLRARVEALERERENDAARAGEVDLSGDELDSITALRAERVSARPWYENVEIHGYGAFTYLDSGGTGAAREASFLVKEASLFVDAEAWEGLSFHLETWVTHYLLDGGRPFRVGELYAGFRDLLGGREDLELGLKVGLVDVPFGEDYLRQYAPDNPLISQSAAYPWAIEEGAVAYGRAGGVHWALAVANGNIGLAADDGPSKLLCAKVYGDVAPDLYLSASVLDSGETGVSTMWLGRGLIRPVGDSAASTAGQSADERIGSLLWEADAHVRDTRRESIRLQVGQAFLDDDADAFDRTLCWVQVEPRLRLSDRLVLVARYSEIATDDSGEGYLFEGDVFGAGEALGYDTNRMQRLACGLGWTIHPHATLKVEVGRDWYDLIPGSPFDAQNGRRVFGGIELVVTF